ncbi:MAG TPA: helix-turn-helix domain-containing protein [Cellvibrionaceae bacterium]
MDTRIFNVHDVVLFMTIIVCVLLALFQWALPASSRRHTSGLLILFLLITGIQSACILILWNDEVRIADFFDLQVVPYLLTFATLGKGPALYFYVASLTQHQFALRTRHLLHLLPIAIAWVCLLTFSLDSDNFLWRSETTTVVTETVVNYLWHASKIIPFLYGVAATYMLMRYHRKLKDQYSSFSSSEPAWLSVLALGFTLSWAFSVVVHISAQFMSIAAADVLGISENYLIFVLINGLFAYSLMYAHQVLTTKPTEITKTISNDKPDEEAITKVHAGMEEAKLFLQHNLNIEEFSTRIDLPVRDVSAVINKHFGTNFFEYMNSYRVEEAKRLLTDKDHADLTVLDILLQAGFNSKSAFHRFFKRLTGMSPSEYRKQSTTSEKATE